MDQTQPPPGLPQSMSPPQLDENQPQLDGQQPQPGEEVQVQPGEQAPPPPGEQPQQPREELVPDGRHSWQVAVAAAWNVFCCSLLRRAMPVMFLAVGDAFATTSKGAVAWMNAFIYSLAYTLSPVVTVQCRTMPLKVLSIGGALLVGVGQIVCFALGSLALLVPVIGLCCGLGAAVSMVVNETVVHLHFEAERRKALSIYRAAFSLSAIAYPLVLGLLVSEYGLDGALLVTGAISLNALAGSLLMARPPWMSPSDPVPSIHRPENADAQPAAELEQGTKADASEKQDASKVLCIALEARSARLNADPGCDSSCMLVAAEELSNAMNPGLVSGGVSGATSVDPGTMGTTGGDGTAATSAAQADGEQAAAVLEGQANADQQPEGAAAEPPKLASHTGVGGTTLDSAVAKTLAAHGALTSLSVTAGALIYDYAMDGDPARSRSATLALLSYGAGDLVGRLCYEALLGDGEHRKVFALQAM
nr:monocarboxylate transporter 8-like [Dermacentor andersoni]